MAFVFIAVAAVVTLLILFLWSPHTWEMGQCFSDMRLGDCGCRRRSNVQQADQRSLETVELTAVCGTRYTDPIVPNFTDQRGLDRLVLRTLHLTEASDNERESMLVLLALNRISDNDNGWIQMVCTLIKLIPMENPFGATTIAILIEDCSIPSTNTVLELMDILKLSRQRALANESLCVERNICVVLGCIASKLVGQQITRILTDKTLEYLVTLLLQTESAILALHSLLALESFAINQENKNTIQIVLVANRDRYLQLEQHINSYDSHWRQVGFCARWTMDNLIVVPNRPLSYEVTDMTGINAILDFYDLSQCLKISSDGLGVRNDSPIFESIRCAYAVTEGCWYYECTLLTNGVMQIGWANEHSNFIGHDGFGIGDDLFSLSYDGCRNMYWYNAQSTRVPPDMPHWRAGDVVGSMIDIEGGEVTFSLNGRLVASCGVLFNNSSTTYTMSYYAGASLMAYQHCQFNFGNKPFLYPPTTRTPKKFNDHSVLRDRHRVGMPRRMILEEIRSTPQSDKCCMLCCDDALELVIIKPCNHGGICGLCMPKLKVCPICRGPILETELQNHD